MRRLLAFGLLGCFLLALTVGCSDRTGKKVGTTTETTNVKPSLPNSLTGETKKDTK